jgi:chloramphenicol 3-O phosphotransferase
MPATEAIILNGTSSAGKSSIARCLQEILPGLWLTFGVDTLIQALPVAGSGIEFAADGAVVTGPEFQRLDATWSQGVATMVRAGTRIIIDEVFLSGAMSQRRWQEALEGSQTLWVGVH